MANHDQYLLFFAILRKQNFNFDPEKDFGIKMEIFANPTFSSSYYEKEMGTNLVREFYIQKNSTHPFSDLTSIKAASKSIEDTARNEQGNRKINIDPGLISYHQVVVSTFKNYSHRIPIGDKIYADLQLIYSQKTFESLNWTYPDYKNLIDEFNKLRTLLS